MRKPDPTKKKKKKPGKSKRKRKARGGFTWWCWWVANAWLAGVEVLARSGFLADLLARWKVESYWVYYRNGDGEESIKTEMDMNATWEHDDVNQVERPSRLAPCLASPGLLRVLHWEFKDYRLYQLRAHTIWQPPSRSVFSDFDLCTLSWFSGGTLLGTLLNNLHHMKTPHCVFFLHH